MTAAPLSRYRSWGRYPPASHEAVRVDWRDDPLPVADDETRTLLAFGNGRSYGDVCLNDGGVLLDARGLDRFIAFDPSTGRLRCEAGVLLGEILDVVVPHGWFLPVTPGTRLVTVGGAIANDVHGKNHHRAGTFGRYVREFELVRSDGAVLTCSPEENRAWFEATIGGLGLTGLVVTAELELRRVPGPFIDAETLRFGSLEAFLDLSAASEAGYDYVVAWVDCLARGESAGRGHLFRGNHSPPGSPRSAKGPAREFGIPVTPPVNLVNRLSVRLFNALYYHRPVRARETVHYRPFFYPLDAIDGWNRIYGPRGFLQYQCVVPFDDGVDAMRDIMARIAAARTGSFLAVLKVFGSVPSPGLMSFPRPGVTLALDFPNDGARTFALLERLDEVVREVGGAVYPAKDALMSAESFRCYFPNLEAFRPFVDPRFSSSFWRRVAGDIG